MTRRAPPPPQDVLHALLRRLAARAPTVHFDTSLPLRVERLVRTRRPARTPTPVADAVPTRSIPRGLACAAVLVLAVAAPLLTPPDATAPARAGPLEARDRYEEARRLAHAPWRKQAAAWQDVLDEARPSDPTHRRALAAFAKALRAARLPHGAAALEARAARLGPRRDPARGKSRLDHARALRTEGDLDAATTGLECVADDTRRADPKLAERALGYLAEDARDRGDPAALAHLLDRLEALGATPSRRLALAGDLGLLLLAAGDPAGARAALARAQAAYDEGVERGGDTEARRCTKRWLDLKLRRDLED